MISAVAASFYSSISNVLGFRFLSVLTIIKYIIESSFSGTITQNFEKPQNLEGI
jgi:hypothetical protein